MKFFEEYLVKSWWVFLFFLLASGCYEQASLVKKKETLKLKKKVTYLHENIAKEEKKKERLQIFLSHQEDPAWIEWALMHYLGMAPEGYIKVILPLDVCMDKDSL